MKKTIVTGGAGFIGSHLVDRLLKDGHEVIAIDNFSSGRKENLSQHKGNKKLKLVKADVADFKKIAKYFKGVDWVFHLAALADIVPSIENPMKYFRANADGTAAVLEASRLNNVKRFLYAGSSSYYGIPDVYPTPETAEIKTEYPYALTKYLGELAVMHWCKIYHLPAVSLRMFNVYGPRARTSGAYGAVFGVFLAQKLAGKPFTVVGDGNQTRDFTFVSDCVEAFILAAQSNISGEVFNISAGQDYSVNEIIKLIGHGNVVHIPKRPGEPDKTLSDNSKAKRMLGWAPKISIEQGVKIMLDNIHYWKGAPVWDEKKIAEATKGWFKYLGQNK